MLPDVVLDRDTLQLTNQIGLGARELGHENAIARGLIGVFTGKQQAHGVGIAGNKTTVQQARELMLLHGGAIVETLALRLETKAIGFGVGAFVGQLAQPAVGFGNRGFGFAQLIGGFVAR